MEDNYFSVCPYNPDPSAQQASTETRLFSETPVV